MEMCHPATGAQADRHAGMRDDVGAQMIPQFWEKVQEEAWSKPKGVLNISLTVFVITCVGTLLLMAASRWVAVIGGLVQRRHERVT